MSTTITVVMPAYDAGRWIDATLASVEAQTRPADEIIVVDDGSTDDTADRARAHGRAITVIQQPNGGPPAAYNRGFDAATSEYVAMCPADDLWDPRKLEWQAASLEAEPTIDILFGQASYFGRKSTDYPRPRGVGLLERRLFAREMYAADLIAAPTAVVRRQLHQTLGRFDEALPSEDYEFWLRSLQAGATFYFDDRHLARLRQHGDNVSSRAAEIWEMNYRLRLAYATLVDDSQLTNRLLARDLRAVARARFGLGQADLARRAYAASLRRKLTLEASAGAALLSVAPLARGGLWLNRNRPRGRTH